MEKTYTMNFTLHNEYVDCFGRLKPSAILYFAQEAAGEHCKLLGADEQALGNLFWAVLRYRVEIARLPERGETVTIKTWPMPTTRVAYPRATEAWDEKGNLLFKCISLWVLMDRDTRAMVLPGKSGVTVEGSVLGGEPEVPSALPVKETREETVRTVGYSELDKNLHMNNTRYLDWADDLLGCEFHKNHLLKAFTVCYLSEAREGQKIALKWTYPQENTLYVDSLRTSEQPDKKPGRVFVVQMEFDSIM